MFLLTFSMIGLQFAWGTEVFSIRQTKRFPSSCSIDDLLHPIPALLGHVQEPHESCLDRWTSLRSRSSANHWYEE
jgi:hypothetical protein